MSKIFIKGIFIILLSIILQPEQLFAQESRVKKASYFRKTQALRDMPIVLPGDRDRSWKDNLIGNRHRDIDFSKMHTDALPIGSDPVLQDNFGAQSQRGPLLNIEGIDNVNGVYPPDTDGDIGPNHYVQMINLSFAIWDRDGNKLYGPVDNSTLWSGFIGPWTGTNDGDPIILYDDNADRWMLSQFAVHASDGTFWELIAISATPDPLGEYYQYAFEFPAFNDYPKFGIWHDGYYASFNMFGEYQRVAAASFERDAMLAGDPDARMILFDLPEGSGPWSMLPADADGTMPPDTVPNYFAYGQNDEFDEEDAIVFWAFTSDWENTENSTFEPAFTLQTEAFNPYLCEAPRTQCIQQPGTGVRLEALSTRLMYRLQYRNFGTHQSMVVNHTVNANGSGLAGIRWYEFRNDNIGDGWYIRQQSTYAPDNQNRWMGSIAMNGNGDIALGFSVSGDVAYPSLRYTGRSDDAPLSTFNHMEIEVATGKSAQTSLNRWGDYSKMSIDPVDDSTFWVTNEYMQGGWKTRIASFNFLTPQAPWVEAGEDATICINEPYQSQAEGGNIREVLWTTSGDGLFTDKYSLNTRYLRGAQDMQNGSVVLNIEAFGYIDGVTTKDSLSLTIIGLPEANAGRDTTICMGAIFGTEASVIDADSIYWMSSGDGNFANPNSLITTYTPGLEDINNGKAYLTLRAFKTGNCPGNTQDRMTLTIDQCTGIQETNEDLLIQINPNPAKDQFTVTVPSQLLDKNIRLRIINMQGQELFAENIFGLSSRSFNARLLNNGNYILILETANSSFSKKFSVQK